jgi:hypothetical protein
MLGRGLVLVLVVLAGCGQSAPAPVFDGERAMDYLRTQLGFGPRIPGTEGHRQVGDWLDSLLTARADTVVVQSWDHRTVSGSTVPLRNFIARFTPSAAVRILLLAHWDTRPRADAAEGDQADLPVPGANDGASGVALLLGIADQLRLAPPAIGVDLLFVDGEDFGSFGDPGWPDVLIGSRYYAANLPPGPKPQFAVLFDMIGDAELEIFQEGNSLTGAPEVVNRVWAAAADLGYGHIFVSRSRHTLTDDHIPLQQIGIPAIDVIDFDYGPDHSYWHTPLDTVDKVSARSLEVVGRVALAVISRTR